MKSRVVTDYSEIKNLVSKIKKPGNAFLTNWYADESKCDFWIKHKVLSCLDLENVSFIFRDHLDFRYLYFVAAGFDSLEIGLRLLTSQFNFVYTVDLLDKGDKSSSLAKIFEGYQFRHHETLLRMNKKQNPNLYSDVTIDEQLYSSKNDAPMILQFLWARLDRFSEQIPTMEELLLMIRNNQVLLIKEGIEIGGILYFEKSGYTSHLREWLVNEKYRNKHFGSRLINKYFQLSGDCSRFILWVKQQNDHAIEIYKHYGYSIDNVDDKIFTNF